jgi:hypothetical protein
MIPGNVFDRKTATIGTLTITVDEAGTVTFTDTDSPMAPIVITRLHKARAAFAMLRRALSKIQACPHCAAEHPQISVEHERTSSVRGWTVQ